MVRKERNLMIACAFHDDFHFVTSSSSSPEDSVSEVSDFTSGLNGDPDTSSPIFFNPSFFLNSVRIRDFLLASWFKAPSTSFLHFFSLHNIRWSEIVRGSLFIDLLNEGNILFAKDDGDDRFRVCCGGVYSCKSLWIADV